MPAPRTYVTAHAVALIASLVAFGFVTTPSAAQPTDPARALRSPRTEGATTELRPQRTLGEELENLGRLYKNDDDDVLQELWVLGRYHGQYYTIEGSNGDDDGYESRRFRLGSQAKLFKKLTLHAQAISGSDFEPNYNGFTELWAQWSFRPEFALTIGQQKHRFTHDRNVSSRYLNYLERSQLTNMFGADYTPAVTAQGKAGDLTYYGGVFSNATGRNMGEAFTELDSGYSLLGMSYYDLGSAFGAEQATVYGSFVHSEANENATNLNRFEEGLSGALILTRGRAALVTEVTAGIGSDAGNAIGLNLQPSYFLTREWQLTARYQLAGSSSPVGLVPQRRYEREIEVPEGDRYQAVYLGVDHYIARHRMKVMQGLEYSTMNGRDAWTASLMLRFYFGPHSGGAFPMNQVLPLAYD